MLLIKTPAIIRAPPIKNDHSHGKMVEDGKKSPA
jgi:hypothetical protein